MSREDNMVREICRMGHPVLRQVAADVPEAFIQSNEFTQLLQDLKDSMEHYGGIGIAAPQIGVSLKMAIIELASVNRYGEAVSLPFTVFVNPELEFLTDEQQGFWEGCLSVPGLRGYVERPRRLRVRYLDEKGTRQELEAEGFLATVIQHELDHLFGVLYVDRIKDMRKLAFQEEYQDFLQHEGEEVD
jgi:peptide deformylase